MTLVTLWYKNPRMSLSSRFPDGKLWVNIMTGPEFSPPLTYFFPLISSPPSAFCFSSLNCIFFFRRQLKKSLDKERSHSLCHKKQIKWNFFFLLKRGNWSACREELTEGRPASVDTANSPVQHIRRREHHGRRGEKVMRGRGPGALLETVSSRYDREAISMTSQQCGCLNKTWIISILVDVPTWMRNLHWSPLLYEKL